MIISICSKKEGLDSLVDDRFGRSENFTIIDTESGEIKTIENTGKDQASGAGGNAVKLLASHNVEVAIVPHLGPKAEKAMEGFGIKTISQGDYKTVGDLLEAYKANKLEVITHKKGLTRV